MFLLDTSRPNHNLCIKANLRPPAPSPWHAHTHFFSLSSGLLYFVIDQRRVKATPTLSFFSFTALKGWETPSPFDSLLQSKRTSPFSCDRRMEMEHPMEHQKRRAQHNENLICKTHLVDCFIFCAFMLHYWLCSNIQNTWSGISRDFCLRFPAAWALRWTLLYVLSGVWTRACCVCLPV